MGWFMPALVFGAGMYIKNKGSAGKFRWLSMTELEAKKLPVIAAVHKSESGEALPAAPPGAKWKPITLLYAAGPFSAPSEVLIHVLDPVPGAPLPEDGIGGALFGLAGDEMDESFGDAGLDGLSDSQLESLAHSLEAEGDGSLGYFVRKKLFARRKRGRRRGHARANAPLVPPPPAAVKVSVPTSRVGPPAWAPAHGFRRKFRPL